MKVGNVLAMLLALIVVTVGVAHAKDNSNGSLAAKSQNPVGDIISLPVENNTYFGVGPAEDWANALFFKPVFPVNLGRLNLINRLIVPLIYIDDQQFNIDFGQISKTVQLDSVFGLGNINYQAFFSPAKPGKIIWGLGCGCCSRFCSEKPTLWRKK
jgi:hypothetical protein